MDRAALARELDERLSSCDLASHTAPPKEEYVELTWFNDAVYNTITEAATRKLAFDLSYKCEKLRLEDGTSTMLSNSGFARDYKYLTARQKEIDAESKVTHYWVTINPDNSRISLADFVALVAKAHAKKWITEYTYVIEYHGSQSQRYYCHSIINKSVNGKSKAKSQAHREFMSTFSHCVGNDRHILITPVTEAQKQIKLNYIKGIKSGQKQELVYLDRIWRRKNNIDELYTNAVSQDILPPQQQSSSLNSNSASNVSQEVHPPPGF